MLKFAKKPSDLFGKPTGLFYLLDSLKTQNEFTDRK